MPRLHGSPPPRETPREEERRENFYARLFDSAQDMWDAERAEGIDDEVALLRGKFRKQVAEHPEDYEAIVLAVFLL